MGDPPTCPVSGVTIVTEVPRTAPRERCVTDLKGGGGGRPCADPHTHRSYCCRFS
ncbi:hypothetical protein HanIR_Chr14g0718961 [Helianthus annuus]|nr:hypothetical protein HanIR_Chr14g0718961 [Helianthus annuus]